MKQVNLPRSIAVAIVLLAGLPAAADVTIEERMSVESNGPLSIADISGTTRTTIAGDRARTQSSTKMKSKMLRMFSPGETAEIVRLDLGKIYYLNLKKKTYTEVTFEEQRAQIQQGLEQLDEAQTSSPGVAESENSACEWSPPETTVELTGDTETIAGYATEHKVVKTTQSCIEPDTAQACDYELTLDQWLTSDFSASSELADYFEKYASALGLSAYGSQDFTQRVQTMFGGYESLWSQTVAEMALSEAYPLRTRISVAIGGPTCAMTDVAAPETPGAGETMGSMIGGKLGGMFGRKRDEAAKQAEAPSPESAGGLTPMMSITSELVSITETTIDPAEFEVPVKFKPARN